MNIDLPERFKYGTSAFLEDGILKVRSDVKIRELITKITLARKGTRCWYCKKILCKDEITMDHLYPKDLGGPTIPNNLAPACSECNVKKGCFTELQFRQLIKAPESKQKQIRNRFIQRNEQYKAERGFFLPRQWITKRKIDNILVTFVMSECYRGRRYDKIEAFYEKYEKLPYPIVVDRNNYLIDGFLVLMFAKNHDIKTVPTIVLDNFEIIFQ